MEEAFRNAYRYMYWGRAWNWQGLAHGHVDDGFNGRANRGAFPGCLRMIEVMGMNNIPEATWFVGAGQAGDAGTCTQ